MFLRHLVPLCHYCWWVGILLVSSDCLSFDYAHLFLQEIDWRTLSHSFVEHLFCFSVFLVKFQFTKCLERGIRATNLNEKKLYWLQLMSTYQNRSKLCLRNTKICFWRVWDCLPWTRKSFSGRFEVICAKYQHMFFIYFLTIQKYFLEISKQKLSWIALCFGQQISSYQFDDDTHLQHINILFIFSTFVFIAILIFFSNTSCVNTLNCL